MRRYLLLTSFRLLTARYADELYMTHIECVGVGYVEVRVATPESCHLQEQMSAYMRLIRSPEDVCTHVCDHIPSINLEIPMLPRKHMVTPRRYSPYSRKEVFHRAKSVEQGAQARMITSIADRVEFNEKSAHGSTEVRT